MSESILTGGFIGSTSGLNTRAWSQARKLRFPSFIKLGPGKSARFLQLSRSETSEKTVQ